jgi:hypothetical protein
MALPKFNNTPKYDLTIPSTKAQIKFRPFVTKEQKVLLMAMESQDNKQVLDAITDTIEACIVSPIKIGSLTTFDIEYIFTQIRAKSVGEKSSVMIACTECEKSTPVEIDLEKIVIDVPKTNMTVKLNDQYTIKLRYPKYQMMLHNNAVHSADTITETLYHVVFACLDSLQSEDENIVFDDEPREEVNTFLESLPTQQFNEIMAFVQSIPKLSHTVEFNCVSCGHHNKTTLQGIQDFF